MTGPAKPAPDSATTFAAVPRPGLRARLEWVLLVALAALLTFGAVRWSVVARLDVALYDAVLSLHGHAPRDDIVIVAIDDQSLEAVGRWPWPRARLAELVARVGAAHPRAVGVDILLIEPDLTDPEGDRALTEAFAQAGHVILPALPERTGQGRVFHYPFLGIGTGVAHIDAAPDPDSVVRGFYLAEGPHGHLLDHLALQLARQSAPVLPAVPRRAEIDADGWTRQANIGVNFAGPAGTFRHVPALALLQGQVPADAFAGKLVLIGATASGVSDIFATPTSRTMSGVEVLANATQTLLDGNAILPAARSVFWLATLLPLALTACALLWLTPRMALAAALGSAMVLLVGVVAALAGWNRWLPPFAALVGPLVLYPLWSWRQQEAALRFLRDELQRLAREPGLLPDTAPLGRTGRTLDAHMDAVASLTDKLRGLRRFLAEALESLPDATVICTHSGEIRLANGRTADLAAQAQTPGQARTAALRDLPTLLARAFDDPAPGQHYWTRWLTAPDTAQELVELRTHDGRSMLMHAAALRDDAGRPVDIIVSFADITAVRQAERHREEALRFISHDMRSPQSAILALIELQRDAGRALGHEALLARIQQLSSRTLELADAFIDLARVESQEIRLSDVDLVGLALDAADEVWALASQHQIEVRVDADIEASVRGEPRMLVRALVNLLNNAIKFSPRGAIVTVAVREEADAFAVSVADQGVGIAAEDQAQLFQPFRRLHEAMADAPSGSGLGLVFVKTVVERHGGRIAVQSAPGHGATFTLWLPRASHPGRP
ncbi:CHASE2 domain-containing protein [Ralstonia solanacearum]|uniref:histidine kinase n=1 Tax=Ralstonia solanacearum TaxID=305 RepID=A0AAW5ZTL4_RALSL|nr:CHASE2 domain-containing protein [Ralstonia solanacearum]MDB0573132.1 CHASE2 domain-containing protein [Ralstonia solanacearum]